MENSEPSLAPPAVAAERRLHPRRLLSLEAQCLILKPDALNAPLAQSTRNLGTRGAGLISDRALDRGLMLMLTLFLPPAAKRKIMHPEEICPAIECQKVAILSRVVWCLPWKGQHRYGVQFLDLERDQRARFKAYLLDLELDHQGSPWYV
ncbi:MAG: PilZ domain-containing protein [Candidatus Firestonebacteria bacterium]|nr:PilZ domain-containing protein [Candidatus Firestonebacteria bacterium]